MGFATLRKDATVDGMSFSYLSASEAPPFVLLDSTVPRMQRGQTLRRPMKDGKTARRCGFDSNEWPFVRISCCSHLAVGLSFFFSCKVFDTRFQKRFQKSVSVTTLQVRESNRRVASTTRTEEALATERGHILPPSHSLPSHGRERIFAQNQGQQILKSLRP